MKTIMHKLLVLTIFFSLTSCRHRDRWNAFEFIIENHSNEDLTIVRKTVRVGIDSTNIPQKQSFTFTYTTRDDIYHYGKRIAAYLYGDSVQAIFNDGRYILYSAIDSSSSRNLLYFKNYKQTYEFTFVFTITEEDRLSAQYAAP